MRLAMVMCVVKGCDNKSKVYSTIMFHRIPTKNKKRKNQWLAVLNIDLKTPVESIKKWRVCSEHFGPDDYLENMDSVTCTTVRRLKDTAIPTIFRLQTGPSGSSPMAVSVTLLFLVSLNDQIEKALLLSLVTCEMQSLRARFARPFGLHSIY